MQKWEYCAVGPIKQLQTHYGHHPRFLAFNPDDPQELSMSGMKGNESRNLLKVISNLGRAGWEMVGCGNVAEYQGGGRHLLYFKRPIED